VNDQPNVCILHDRHAGILKVIKTLKEHGEETPWIDIQSRWCMHHLWANFYTQFRNKNLMNLFKKLCIQNQLWKYSFVRTKLHEFTKQQVVQRKAARDANVIAHMHAVFLRGNRALPITTIVEGIFLGTVKYFRDRRQKAHMHMMNNPTTLYRSKIMQYMDAKEKARHLPVVPIGNEERRFEVYLQIGSGFEIRRGCTM
jgi:hypothetical protein